MSGERTRPGGDAASRSSGTALVVNSVKGQGEASRAGWGQIKDKSCGGIAIGKCVKSDRLHQHIASTRAREPSSTSAAAPVCLLQLLPPAPVNFALQLPLSCLQLLQPPGSSNTQVKSATIFFLFSFFLGTDGDERKRLQAENGRMAGSQLQNYLLRQTRRRTGVGSKSLSGAGETGSWKAAHCVNRGMTNHRHSHG